MSIDIEAERKAAFEEYCHAMADGPEPDFTTWAYADSDVESMYLSFCGGAAWQARAALAAPQQEPVAVRWPNGYGRYDYCDISATLSSETLRVAERLYITTPPASPVLSDDVAVDNFADVMKKKLAESRLKGRGGWDDPTECSIEYLSRLLIGHVDKGDPVDVGNFAMMIQQRGGRIKSPAAPVLSDADIINVFLESWDGSMGIPYSCLITSGRALLAKGAKP